GLLVAPLVRDVPEVEKVRVAVDPVDRRTGGVLELPDESAISGPLLVLVEQDDKERRRVGRTEVRGVGTLLEGRQLAVAHLVHDSTRVFVTKVVEAGSLSLGASQQRRSGEFSVER